MSFNLLVNFWAKTDDSMTWNVMRDKISILYYFNDENIELEKMLLLLNEFTKTYRLDFQGWKLPFTMAESGPERWNYDYVKRLEFFIYRYLKNIKKTTGKMKHTASQQKSFFEHPRKMLVGFAP